jgi:tripartite-type tricarboxylate transporter receptor subunit TctC
MPMMERTALALTLMSALALPIAHANAQSWQRAVRVIVPLPPGIPTDLVCRLFANRLAERWRQPMVVENRQGSDGIPAVDAISMMNGQKTRPEDHMATSLSISTFERTKS